MKVICPDCDSNIEFCVEETVLHKRIVDPKTGKLKKRVKIESEGIPADRAVFQCTNCSWSCTDGSPEYPQFLRATNEDDRNDLLEKISLKAFNNPL